MRIDASRPHDSQRGRRVRWAGASREERLTESTKATPWGRNFVCDKMYKGGKSDEAGWAGAGRSEGVIDGMKGKVGRRI